MALYTIIIPDLHHLVNVVETVPTQSRDSCRACIQSAEAIISRGTFSWPTIAPLLDPLMPDGQLYLWIGQNPSEETFCGAIRELGHDPSWGSYDLEQAGLRHMGMVSKRVRL